MPRLTKEEKEKQKLAALKKEEALRKRKRVKDEILAVVFIAIGLFLIISMFTGTTGAVGAAIKSFLGGLLGWVSYILPFFLIVYGVLVFAQKTSLVTFKSVIACIALFALLTCLIANFKVPLKGNTSYDFSMSLKEIYAMGTDGGGIIGVYVGGFIKNLIGNVGLYIVSAAGVIIALLLILNTPLSTLIDNARIRHKARKAQREHEREEQLEMEALEMERKAEEKRLAEEAAKKESDAAAKQRAQERAKTHVDLTPVDNQQQIDTGALPKLNMSAVENMEPEKAVSSEDVAEKTLPQFAVDVPEAKPSFTPEDIGLKSPEKPAIDMEGITENQKKVLDLVMDQDLFTGTPKNTEDLSELPQNPSGTKGLSPLGVAAAAVAASTDPSVIDKAADGDAKAAAPAKLSKAEVGAATAALTNEIENKKAEAKPEPAYKFPPVDLLAKPSATLRGSQTGPNMQDQAELLEDTLASFGVQATVVDVVKGPAVTRFEVQPASGVKVSKIAALHNDLALNLRAKSLRIEAPIPGKAAVGIEVSNDTISTVTLREIIESEAFKMSKSKITVAIGRSIGGDCIVADLKSMPHLLVAGSTGSGKSVCINSMIISLLYKATPEEVKLILIDPKVVELSIYNGLPHLMIPVVTDAGKAAAALGWAVSEMNERYNKFAAEGVRDLQSYNETVRANGEEEKVMPQIVIIIDELAELIMTAKNTVEDSICRIAQKARAAGMHLIVATQRPSTDVITGVIKANIPSRIAFAVSSLTDSRVILDVGGAEHLLGKGDMLYGPQSISKPLRVQGCFVSDNEVRDVINYVKDQVQMAGYNDDILQIMNRAGSGGSAQSEESSDEDELLTDAIETVVRAEQCSVSMLQRRFRIGYNRAARLVDLMEERGIVGPPDGARPRKVIMTLDQFQQLQNQAAGIDGPVEEEIF